MKFNNGAFAFYRVSAQCKPMTPLEIEALAHAHSIPTSIVPSYAGDRQQVSRAIGQVSAHLGRQGWMLDAIRQSKHEVVYAIVRKDKDTAREHIDYNQDDKIQWSDENGNGHYVYGNHEIARKVDAAYQELRGKVCAGDWTASIVSYLKDICYAQPIRDDGYIYWIAPSHLDAVRQLQPFLEAVGISLVICEVESESVQVVQAAAQEGLAEQLSKLEEEITDFDGKQKPTTYRLRVEALQALRKRATVYEGTLGIAVDQVKAMIDTLEAKAQDMLTLRELIVVHKDGNKERSTNGSSHSTRKETAESFLAPSATRQPLQSTLEPMAPDNKWTQVGFSW